jgi:hypothetical protein|tara:strand:- start:336 stop:776 length:441 start_codon:yes stop_codon:yes gene_type:complete
MGVPGSGTLSMLKMAREAKHGDYNGSQSMGTISMYDMMNGGNTGGSTVSYPTLNTSCTPNPTSCETYAAINSATNPASNSITVYYRSDVYSSQSSFVNTIGAVAYSSSTGSTHHPAGNGYNFEYIICTNEVNLNSSGQIITTTPIC